MVCHVFENVASRNIIVHAFKEDRERFYTKWVESSFVLVIAIQTHVENNIAKCCNFKVLMNFKTNFIHQQLFTILWNSDVISSAQAILRHSHSLNRPSRDSLGFVASNQTLCLLFLT